MIKNNTLYFSSGFAAALLGSALASGQAWAQGAPSYPNKPLRYIVGYTPGGTADMLARAVGQKLTKWGKAVKASGARVD